MKKKRKKIGRGAVTAAGSCQGKIVNTVESVPTVRECLLNRFKREMRGRQNGWPCKKATLDGFALFCPSCGDDNGSCRTPQVLGLEMCSLQE